MTAAEAVQLFEAQLKRAIQVEGLKIKVLCAPLAIREPGLSLRLLPRKVSVSSRTQKDRTEGGTVVVVGILLSSRIESDAALQRFLAASEFLVKQSQEVRRLENTDGTAVLNSSISWSTQEEDAVFEDPVDETVVWAREEWRARIYLP